MWKYIKPLTNKKAVREFHQKYNIKIPVKLLVFLEKNNGGRPEQTLIKTGKGEYVFKALLSYNEEDKENIYNLYPHLFKDSQLFPLATDAAGNFICYDVKADKFYLWNHESNAQEQILNIEQVLDC